MFEKIKRKLNIGNDFKIVELTVEDIIGNELENILKSKISGVIIKKFFDPEVKLEIDFSQFSKRETPFGFTTGLSIFNSKSDLSDYFEENKEYNLKLEESLKEIKYRERLELVFSKIYKNNTAEVYNNHSENKYKISTLRVIESNKEGIQQHIGNEFMFSFAQTLPIRRDTVNRTQFSFFLLLQKPEIEGELILFDKLWKNTPNNIIESGSLIYKKEERSNFLINSNSIPINLEKGDLLIFDGGRIWHEVRAVKGNKDRVTVGGFLAISINKDKVYYWS